ncbi:glycoside hydrolase family 88 protein [Bacillus sp. IB182487]|uniref:Glycoside hydrolase family 88 protein n=2 Tax=Metabacillus arenae TaxID=2771434 RepID=A0A926NQQ3_9BACI|nr:glycoside hydrolase family 88 protein [Metabacillus arenae]MBD1382272.1 glycoside hydrolase family 88 protein [Metabacillus arenae]
MDHIADEGIQDKRFFETDIYFSEKDGKAALTHILNKMDQNLEMFTTKYPTPSSVNFNYQPLDNIDWTAGFWTGMLWLAYELTSDEKYRRIAETQLDSFKERIDKRIHVDTHDLGFLYTLSAISAYKLTESNEAKQMALQAADLLVDRYHEKAGILQAWGDLTNPNQRGRMIIDCNMNLPLLYWASEVTGRDKYYQIANSHAWQAARYIVRNDSSTYHTFYMNPETGEPIKGDTHQGFSDESCWSRGQAWAIYGFTLSYLYTNDLRYIDTAKKTANYFLNRLPSDFVCYWDLIFTEGNEERDSSGAAIAACGLLELSKHLPLLDENKKIYENAALRIILSLSENYTTKNNNQSNGILLQGVYHKRENVGVNECCIWGDYFYFEALVRLIKDWKPYW